MRFWYYIIMKETPPGMNVVGLSMFSYISLKENSNNWTDDIFFLQEICLDHQGTPKLIDPYTVELNGEVIFKLENKTVITEIARQLLCTQNNS